jgi:hypothetical protein
MEVNRMQMETVAVVDGIPSGAWAAAPCAGRADAGSGTNGSSGSNGAVGASARSTGAAPVHEPLDVGWSATFLSPASEVRLAVEGARFATALGLSAAYGLALGLRGGVRGMATEALLIPAAWLAIAGLGVPALAILLALADAPVRAVELAGAASRAAARASLILFGLAPPIALFAVTTDEAASAVLLGGVGLAVAWTFGLRAFAGEILRASHRSRGPTLAATLGFAVFATALAGRVWLCGLAPLWGAP